jgi:class 3 adenylate cyclase
MAFIYDKSGDEMNNTVLLKIIDSTSKTIYQKIISTNQPVTFETSSNNLPGYATVTAENGNLSAEKTFQISELKKIAATIKDGKIILTNVGNVPYSGPVEIQVGGEIFTQTITLGYNENKSFDITAPDGFYDVSVNDGNPILSQSSVSLTGNVISLRESGAKIGDYVANNPIVWIFIAGIIILFLVVFYKRHYENKRLFGSLDKPNKIKVLDMRKKGGIEVINPGKVMDQIVAGGEIRKAEQMTVLHGQKQPASIISLKIKNNVDGIAQDNITKALDYGYKQKAVSYSTGNGAILIFSPLVTKKNKNEEAAVKVALDIDAFLKEHNRKFRNDKISYGIGVNSGEIVNQLNGKVLQFANINKTINIAKKVADLANDEVLLSKDIHEKTTNSIKSDKVTSGAMELFTVKRVINTQETQKFMNEFMRRNTVK